VVGIARVFCGALARRAALFGPGSPSIMGGDADLGRA